jgi:hypothetical protein
MRKKIKDFVKFGIKGEHYERNKKQPKDIDSLPEKTKMRPQLHKQTVIDYDKIDRIIEKFDKKGLTLEDTLHHHVFPYVNEDMKKTISTHYKKTEIKKETIEWKLVEEETIEKSSEGETPVKEKIQKRKLNRK